MVLPNKPRYKRQIIIRKLDLPREHNLQKEVDWICQCLGLADSKDDLAAEIFKELLHATKERSGVSSKEIMEKKKVTQGAVVYHLNIFMGSGIVIKQGRRYYLRSASLDETIEDLETDMLRRIKKLRALARHIDQELRQNEGF